MHPSSTVSSPDASAHCAALIESFFDSGTSTISYLVLDPATRCCALIDTVLGFDPRTGRTDHSGADRMIARVRQLGGELQWLLETHVHADHLSAAAYIREQLGGRIGIGRHVAAVQALFGKLFNLKETPTAGGSQFDHLFADEESFGIGRLDILALHTPGHTPACMTYLLANTTGAGRAAIDGSDAVAFVGDTLFAPGRGTARCDFPGGDAATLFRSIQRILALPLATRLYLCHCDEQDRAMTACRTTVGAHRNGNIHVRDGIAEDVFVALRQARDATLAVPALLLPAVQVNLRAGRFPAAEDNGLRYLKLPVDGFPEQKQTAKAPTKIVLK